MNGRIYDPLLGRFLSADLQIQFPGTLQSYNRYSYCRNNPLKAVDLTGWGEVPFFIQTQQAAYGISPQAGAAHDQAMINGTPVMLEMVGQVAVGHVPYAGTGVAIAQDYQALRDGGTLDISLAVVDILIIGVTFGSENVHGEINAGKTMAKEVRTIEKSVSTEAHAAENVVKQEAEALAHEGTNQPKLNSGTPDPKPVEVSSQPSSKELRDNMADAGRPVGNDEAAHHIVAGTDKRAAESRELLAEAGIPINSEANGVGLPKNTKSPNPDGKTVHSTMHTNEYHEGVAETLRNTPAEDREAALRAIAEELEKNKKK